MNAMIRWLLCLMLAVTVAGCSSKSSPEPNSSSLIRSAENRKEDSSTSTQHSASFLRSGDRNQDASQGMPVGAGSVSSDDVSSESGNISSSSTTKGGKISPSDIHRRGWISTKLSGSRTLGNMSFSEPTEWNPTEAASPKGMYYYPYGNKYSGLVYVAYQNLPRLSGNLTSDYEDYIEGAVTSEGEIQSKESVTLAGKPAYRARVFLSVHEPHDIEAIMYVVVDEEYVYTFIFGDRGSLSNDMSVFSDDMIASVQFNSTSANNTSKDTPNKGESGASSQEPIQKATSEQASTSQASNSNTPAPTRAQQNALSSAKSYLRVSAFSHDGLIGQLKYEGYTDEEAAYGADNCGADWNEQALKSAKQYLSISAFSASGLKKQLEYEKFTSAQAEYAVNNCGADWDEQAKKSAESYLSIMSFSRSGLIDQLIYEGFTRSQAEYGVSANGL